VNAVIYLDYAASTPIDPRVVEAMDPYHGAANASSAHAAGRVAAEAVEEARQEIACLIGGSPGEVVFTSGATEADNLAIGGAIRAAGEGHLITAGSEHKAVLETVREWCPEATIVPVDGDGYVDPDRIQSAIRDDTVLVSVMTANNEVGTLAALDDIGAICSARGVLFHTDAAQAAGKMPIDVNTTPIDLMSLSAHKMYGPKGIGALWIRRGVRDRIKPLMLGGGHERGFRSGTTNVAGCVGFGHAARIAAAELPADERHCRQLRFHLLAAVSGRFEAADLNGHAERTIAGIVNLRLSSVDAESLLLATPHVAASTGSACTSAVPAPSHVLLAMGLDHAAATESVRLSFGRFTTREEIDTAVEAFEASAEMIQEATAEVPA
jgi:cysteine desulfurase